MKLFRFGFFSLLILVAVAMSACGTVNGVNANEAAGAIAKSVSLVGNSSKALVSGTISGDQGGTISFSGDTATGGTSGTATLTNCAVKGDDGLTYTMNGTLSIGWTLTLNGLTSGSYVFSISGTLTIADSNGNTTSSAVDLNTTSSWTIGAGNLTWTTSTTGAIGGVRVNKERSFTVTVI